jgi:hypothetical protein
MKASDVSAGMRQITHKSASDRIGHPGEDDFRAKFINDANDQLTCTLRANPGGGA